MALIKCPECGERISENAASCPYCGTPMNDKIFCKFCGKQIDKDCVICPECGKQIKELNQASDKNIIINNNVTASASASANAYVPNVHGQPKNKWISFLLCFFTICGHKFYEGKIGMGVIYLLTAGLFGIGWIIDIFSLLCKPNPYYV